ncbi:hypothetical protein VOLCADRAFT_89086 [Volvox carteri f. nagariensis]|uniref:PI3K/PI4K catalytic domain-containing protein n=1 Tax=Volvox carteri f. nagariensis TaxID=3068 RepID=D8TQR7_VOLCA|nr:uncharacterized protein VOLCADRAFT_89086 [Volvox carteri f. nagariensis]EFJ50201.1 hypothetical protein VOLCADRAFT_89086 [Volvox carteri f. nagariensis]|eukprot:XP_002948821.1 hypothetical protein VOLCADRAFT_89086 [Volvox carteri f. nagariensis]
MGVQPTPRSLLILALGWAGLIGSADAAMPHISQCRLCHKCHLAAGGGPRIATTTAKQVLPIRKKRAPMYDPELDPLVPIQFKPSSYRPQSQNDMASLPDWIFRTNTNMTPSGEAVVKVYCIPISKRVTGSKPTCNPVRIAEIMRHLLALDKLSQDCGFTFYSWWGLWMEYVEGVSLENVLFKGVPKRLPLETIADLFNNRLNTTRVIRAAIFDLLTSQCDRHAQNLLIQEDGNFKLIDNESCLQHMWRNCAFDSVLVPTTQKQEIVRLANHYVLKLPTVTGGNAIPHAFADPRLLFDYRCYLPDGREQMGTKYPPQIGTCLKRVASMTPKENSRCSSRVACLHGIGIANSLPPTNPACALAPLLVLPPVPPRARKIVKYYGFPDERVANNLLTRATDMITRGFEWAAKYGHPQNAPPKRYRFQPKCCKVRVEKTQFQCAHPWSPSLELPFGNAITGQPWDKDRPDPGSYVGGTFPEDGELGENATAAALGTAIAGTAVGTATWTR